MNQVFEEAREHVENALADTEAESSQAAETPTEQEAAEVAAEEVALDYSDITSVASHLAENPDASADILRNFKRHVDGVNGAKIDKLQQEFQQLQVEDARRQGQLEAKNDTPVSDEPDEHGFTKAHYDELDKILAKLPSRQQEKAQVQNTEEVAKQTQVATMLNSALSHYGDILTPKRQETIVRVAKLAGWNMNDPDVAAVCNDIKEAMDAELQAKTNGKVAGEQENKAETRRRVNSTVETPRRGTRQTGDISIRDEKGNITPDSLAEAAQKYGRTL